MYKVIRYPKYDFASESYSDLYPNLHPYPASMLPQIAIEILDEINIPKKSSLLDPYCGSGTSFCAGIEHGLSNLQGYDLNPFAVSLTQARFTKLSKKKLECVRDKIRNDILYLSFCNKTESNFIPPYHNINYWFSQDILKKLSNIRKITLSIDDKNIQRLFMIALYATARACSYTRKGEFKLYRMLEEKLHKFNPNPYSIYLEKVEYVIKTYFERYYPKLKRTHLKISNRLSPNNFDVVLTSPPYGDSRTTVAYGQFSFFANLWAGYDNANKIDSQLMGGKATKHIFNGSIITKDIKKIERQDPKRALEVSAFYEDLSNSIEKIAAAIKVGGFAIYVVGNRRVKSIQLKTDQFIAEQFEKRGFKIAPIYKRAIHNKAMPSKNSPTNITGKTEKTMEYEYIIIAQKST